MTRFRIEDLPKDDLSRLGLINVGNDQLNLADLDLHALLSGNRTGILRCRNVSDDSQTIQELDIRLSIVEGRQGSELRIHPIYKAGRIPEFLSSDLGNKLQMGSIANVFTSVNGVTKIIEYDDITREYVVSSPERIVVPHMINGEVLSEEQKRDFREGKIISTVEGTAVCFSGVDENMLKSNKSALCMRMNDVSLPIKKHKLLPIDKRSSKIESDLLSHAYYQELLNIENGEGYQKGLTIDSAHHSPVNSR